MFLVEYSKNQFLPPFLFTCLSDVGKSIKSLHIQFAENKRLGVVFRTLVKLGSSKCFNISRCNVKFLGIKDVGLTGYGTLFLGGSKPEKVLRKMMCSNEMLGCINTRMYKSEDIEQE